VPPETTTSRLKRLTMRSWRRGTKEMDLILGPFADAHLATMSEADIVTYDALLNEIDTDLYLWLTGKSGAPQPLRAMLDQVARYAKTR